MSDDLKPKIDYDRPNPECQNCGGTGGAMGVDYPSPCGACWTKELRLLVTNSKGIEPIFVRGLLFKQAEKIIHILDKYAGARLQYAVWDEAGNLIANNNPARFDDFTVSKSRVPWRHFVKE